MRSTYNLLHSFEEEGLETVYEQESSLVVDDSTPRHLPPWECAQNVVFCVQFESQSQWKWNDVIYK